MKNLSMAAAILLLSACSVLNPYNAAETTEQRAYAVSASYNIVLESARDIVLDESLPSDVRIKVQETVAYTTPVISALDSALLDFIVERAKLDGADTAEDKLNVLADNLALWLLKAESALVQLVAAVNGE